jgi:hypothetical protein
MAGGAGKNNVSMTMMIKSKPENLQLNRAVTHLILLAS